MINRSFSTAADRNGFVLVVVLAIVVVLSLAAYQFADRMTTERQIVAHFVEESNCRQAAESGVDYLIGMFSDESVDVSLLPELVEELIAHELDPDMENENPIRFTIIGGVDELDPAVIEYGVRSEQGKLNLNALASLDVPLENQRDMLMGLPDMTETLADTILDFIDSDGTPRDFGTETDDSYYLVRNAPLDSLDDLLLIPEVTAELLYGEDDNGNGILDPEEDDGTLSWPPDNADGLLQLGWNQYLTLWGRQSNLQFDGTPKINLNTDDLEQLRADLAVEFGEELADFVVAYRESGPQTEDDQGGNSSGGEGRSGERLGVDFDMSSSSEQNSTGVDTIQAQSTDQQSRGNSSSTSSGVTRIEAQTSTRSGNSRSGGGGSSGGSSPQGGGQAGFRIQSIFELFDAQVAGDDDQVMTSPWTSSDLSFLEQIYETTSLTDTETVPGKIDLNHARYEVLIGLPDISDSLAEYIVSQASPFSTPGDLLQNGVVDIETMRKIEPFLTTRSGVFRFRSIGFSPRTGIQVSIESVIDIAGNLPLILEHRELNSPTPTWTIPQLFGEVEEEL